MARLAYNIDALELMWLVIDMHDNMHHYFNSQFAADEKKKELDEMHGKASEIQIIMYIRKRK